MYSLLLQLLFSSISTSSPLERLFRQATSVIGFDQGPPSTGIDLVITVTKQIDLYLSILAGKAS
jgi:hypothetical protein